MILNLQIILSKIFPLIIISLTSINSAISQSNSSGQNIGNTETDNKTLSENIKLLVKEESKRISLKETIEEGLRLNLDENIRDYTKKILGLNWSNTYDSFWYPNLQLKLETSSDKIWKAYKLKAPNTQETTVGPDGILSLGFSKFNIFDWGKSYLSFKNSKETFKRSDQILKEERIHLKLDLIRQFFKTANARKHERIYRSQIDQAHHLYKLAKYKKSLKTVSEQEYLAARAEWLRSQSEYYSSFLDILEESKNLSEILGNKNEHFSYNIEEELVFIPLTTSLNKLIKIGQTKPSKINNYSLEYKNAIRNYKKTIKELLPLPSFDLYLGAFTQSFSNESYSGTFSGHNQSNSLEMIASINMTWTLWGENGFLNIRKKKNAEYLRSIAELKYKHEKRKSKNITTSHFLKIKNLENQVILSQYRLENALKSFDSTLERYTNAKVSFDEIRQALYNLRDSKIFFENTKFKHIEQKLILAKYLNLEDFPGENFENSAKLNMRK
jgi:outer membrane protein TolC